VRILKANNEESDNKMNLLLILSEEKVVIEKYLAVITKHIIREREQYLI
jgi:hypothetical protein